MIWNIAMMKQGRVLKKYIYIYLCVIKPYIYIYQSTLKVTDQSEVNGIQNDIILSNTTFNSILDHEPYTEYQHKQGKLFTSSSTSMVSPAHGCVGTPFPHSPGLRSLGTYDLPHDHGNRHAHHTSCHHCCHAAASGYVRIRE